PAPPGNTAGFAGRGSQRGPGPLSLMAPCAASGSGDHSSSSLLVRPCHYGRGMARPRAVRLGPPLSHLARSGACLFSSRSPPVLVAGYSSVAQPIEMAALEDDPLSLTRRPRQHSAIGSSEFFQSRLVYDVRSCTSPLGDLCDRRSSDSRRHHVGTRIDCLPR